MLGRRILLFYSYFLVDPTPFSPPTTPPVTATDLSDSGSSQQIFLRRRPSWDNDATDDDGENGMEYNSNSSFHSISFYDLVDTQNRLECETKGKGHLLNSLILIDCTTFKDCDQRRRECERDETKCQQETITNQSGGAFSSVHPCHHPESTLTSFECIGVDFDELKSPCLVICSSTSVGRIRGKIEVKRTYDLIFPIPSNVLTIVSPQYILHSQSGSKNFPNEIWLKTSWAERLFYQFLKKDSLTTLVSIYRNEEIRFFCGAFKFLFRTTINVIKKDGTRLDIDSNLFRTWPTFPLLLGFDELVGLVRFRMPKDVVSVSCTFERWDTHVRTEMGFKVVVRDLPTNVTATASSSSSSSTNGTFVVPTGTLVGCNLTGDGNERVMAERKLRSRFYDLRITTILDFLRLAHMDNVGFPICHQLLDDGENSTNKFDYYVKLVPSSPPKILRNSSAVQMIDFRAGQREETTDNETFISCQYGGSPMPYILWLRNGQEFRYSIGDLESEEGETMMEKSILILPTKTDQINETTTVNYTCLAVNHVGSDRLEFVVHYGDPTVKNTHQNYQNGKANIFGLVIVALGLTLFVGLGSWHLFKKHFLNKMNFNWWPRRVMMPTPTIEAAINVVELEYDTSNCIVNANARADLLEGAETEEEEETNAKWL